MKSPRSAFVGFPSGRGALPESYLPSRGPSTMADTSPTQPPSRCTTPEPPMSTAPILARNPSGFQIQPAGTQYMAVFSIEKTQYDVNFVLSAMAPDTRVVEVVA